ncbi:hypothetical protein GQ43DRAFT_266212 [Delitschia confertaspora ATCC 74209]|uniref:Uncharacterized protein n=1 Tax=Delitschia confertaspora ATCC 74209 TaxID=1513339 RepID=A0A9P4MTM8_9PLEO|nr:hypothetical protein GQ43DRAFT_266212 [Delitschia confertaspora ATCC 74209]
MHIHEDMFTDDLRLLQGGGLRLRGRACWQLVYSNCLFSPKLYFGRHYFDTLAAIDHMYTRSHIAIVYASIALNSSCFRYNCTLWSSP